MTDVYSVGLAARGLVPQATATAPCPTRAHHAGCACAFIAQSAPDGPFGSIYERATLNTALHLICLGAASTSQLRDGSFAHGAQSLRDLIYSGLVVPAVPVNEATQPGRLPTILIVRDDVAAQSLVNHWADRVGATPFIVRRPPTWHDALLLSELRNHLANQFGVEIVRWVRDSWSQRVAQSGVLRVEGFDRQGVTYVRGTVVLVNRQTRSTLDDIVAAVAEQHVRRHRRDPLLFVLTHDQALRGDAATLARKVARNLHLDLRRNPPVSGPLEFESAIDRIIQDTCVVRWTDWFKHGMPVDRFEKAEARSLTKFDEWSTPLTSPWMDAPAAGEASTTATTSGAEE